MMAMIRGLDPGQSYSRSTRVPVATLADADDMVAKALKKLRNLIGQATGRVRTQKPENTYVVEAVTGITHGNDAILCTVAVTCVGDLADDDEDEVDI